MTSLDTAAAGLKPFCSTDPDRGHMALPYGLRLNGAWYLVATNGHIAAGVRCEDAQGVVVPNAPPLDAVLDGEGTDNLGSVRAEALAAARQLPGAWTTLLQWGCEGNPARLTASRLHGKYKAKRTKILNNVAVDWPLALDLVKDAGINVGYLLDAFDFVGAGICRVFGRRSNPEAPFIFAATEWHDAPRFATVMPVRV